jgi:serine/threonine protein kinase
VFVDFFGWFKDGSDVFLVMEYVQLGDLEKNILAHSGKISETETRQIAEQILSGLKIMHAESFAHRDLKPQVYYYNGHLSVFDTNLLRLIERFSRQWATRMVDKACRLRVKQEINRYYSILYARRHSVIYGS